MPPEGHERWCDEDGGLDAAGDLREHPPGAPARALLGGAVLGLEAVDFHDGLAVDEVQDPVVLAIAADDEDLGADRGDVGLAGLGQRDEAVVEAMTAIPVLQDASALRTIGHRTLLLPISPEWPLSRPAGRRR